LSHDTIRAIFETILTEYAEDNNLRVAYHNVPFTPEAKETFLKSNILPSRTDSNDLQGKHRLYGGVYQIMIVTPKGKGSLVASEIIKDLEQLYPLYTPMYEDPLDPDSFFVQVTTPFQSPFGESDIGDTEAVFPVSFQYRADTQLN
jgi:hypothetical protein